MTDSELKIKIAESNNKEWIKSIKSVFNFNYIDSVITIEGLSAVYEYVSQQKIGWEKYDNLPIELQNSKQYFDTLYSQITNFIINFINLPEYNINAYWNNIENSINNISLKPIPYNIPQTDFLVKISHSNPIYLPGAFNFIVGKSYSTNTKELFYGALLAYEFTFKTNSDILERRNVEEKSLEKIRNDFQNYLSKSESTLIQHLSNTSTKFNEYAKQIDTLKTQKESNFNSWFENTKNDKWEIWYTDSIKKTKDLEETYREKLKLEEPAMYWLNRSKDLKKQGWIALGILVVLVLVTCYSLGVILWTAPEQIYTSWFGDDKSAAIRWSIVYVTLISFIAFCIRSVTKVMFSSFHLARDCEERYTLTYFYLSLLKESKVDEKDRQLIMQSLFSRAETGLLKEDSSPTMPNDAISKIISK